MVYWVPKKVKISWEGTFRSSFLEKSKDKIGQVKLVQVKLVQIKLGQVKLGQV